MHAPTTVRRRRPALFAVFALALGVLLPLGPFASPAATALAQPLDTATDRELNAVAYVVEVLDKVQRHHPDGDRFTRQAFIDGARDGITRALRLKPDMPQADKDILIPFLEGRQFRSIAQLLHVCESYSQRGTPLNMTGVADAACGGILAVVDDPFSRLLTMDEVRRMQETMMQPRDKSIGISPQPIDGDDPADTTLRLEVGHVRRGYLGWNMGLRAGDEILEIGGVPVRNIPREALRERFNAEIGERVELTIRREGHDEPMIVSGVQRTHDHPSAHGLMLPGHIGYVDTNMFTLDLHTSVMREIDQLRSRGARSVIIDLRNNPGGALPACVELCDAFLEPGELITTTKGTYENPLADLAMLFNQQFDMGRRVDDETVVFEAQHEDPYDVPVVLLINGMSASASEMFSGCLKSHRRATLVGTTTFGKGVGQTAVMLARTPTGAMSMGSMFLGGSDMRLLYMTVMTYYLPHGEDVHHIGVSPDIEVAADEPDAPTFAKLAALHARGSIKAYLDQTWNTHEGFFRQQIDGAPAPLDQYPSQALLGRVMGDDHGLTDARLARAVRHAIAVRLMADVNLADDNQLHAAIREAARQSNVELDGIDRYRHFVR